MAAIGDASHAMPPFAGNGVDLAVLDALELANALTADPAQDVTKAAMEFETTMQHRTRNGIGACLEIRRTTRDGSVPR